LQIEKAVNPIAIENIQVTTLLTTGEKKMHTHLAHNSRRKESTSSVRRMPKIQFFFKLLFFEFSQWGQK
jgi:hypothetical protein